MASASLCSPSKTASSLGDLHTDRRFKKFLSHDFDASEFVARLIERDSHSTESFLDQLKTQAARIDHRIATHVTEHHPTLTNRIGHLSMLRRNMKDVREKCVALKLSMQRTNEAILVPYQAVSDGVARIERMHNATDALRRTLRCLHALEALKQAMAPFDRGGEAPSPRDVAKAASALRESEDAILAPILQGVDLIDKQRDFVQASGRRIRAEATDCLQACVQALNQTDLGNALQAFYSLGCLPQEVENVVLFLANTLADIATDALEVPAKPSPSDAPQVRGQLWQQLEGFWERLHIISMQVWNLERVLAKKRDPMNHEVFLNVIVGVSKEKAYRRREEDEGGSTRQRTEVEDGGTPFRSFWRKAAIAIGKRFAANAKQNALVKRVLTQEYPRLRLAMQDVLERMFRTTDNRARQIGQSGIGRDKWQQDTLFGAFAPFLKVYLARSRSRMLSHVPESMASPANARSLATAVARELRAVSRDKGLLAVVEKGVKNVTSELVGRAIRHAALELPGPSNAAVTTLVALEQELLGTLDGTEELILLQDMIALLKDPHETLSSGALTSLPTSVVHHVVIGLCPPELEFPHKLTIPKALGDLDLPASQDAYVSAWLVGSEMEARKLVLEALDIYRQRISAQDDAGAAEDDAYITMLRQLL